MLLHMVTTPLPSTWYTMYVPLRQAISAQYYTLHMPIQSAKQKMYLSVIILGS